MKRVLVLAAAVAAASAGGGCAGARYVHKTADEGVVAIPANSDTWPGFHRTNAEKLIREHVGSGYEIVVEEPVQTGTQTTTVQNTDRQPAAAFDPAAPVGPADRMTTTSTTTTSPVTEWQIHYRRRPGGAAGPAVAPAGGVVQAHHAVPAGPGPMPAVLPAAAGSASPAGLAGR